MRKPLFVFCADLQARESAYRHIKDLAGDDLFALLQVVRYCIDNQVKTLILGGDQVDIPSISDDHTISIRAILSHAKSNGVSTHYIDGNHERGFRRWHLEGGAASVAAPLTSLDLSGVSVIGESWHPRRWWEENHSKLPHAEILVIHGFAQEAGERLGLPDTEKILGDFSIDWFDGKYSLVMMGDVHERMTLFGNKGTVFNYPGSMWMHRANETIDKYFAVVYSDYTVDFIRLKCRPILRKTLEAEDDLREVEEWVQATTSQGQESSVEEMQISNYTFKVGGKVFSVHKPRVHLKLQPALEGLDLSMTDAKKKCFLFDERSTSIVSALKSEDMQDKFTLEGALKECVKENKEVFEFLKEAIESNVETAVSTLKERIGVS